MKIVEIIENIGDKDWWLVTCECNQCPGQFAVAPDERKTGIVKCRYCQENFDVETLLSVWRSK